MQNSVPFRTPSPENITEKPIESSPEVDLHKSLRLEEKLVEFQEENEMLTEAKELEESNCNELESTVEDLEGKLDTIQIEERNLKVNDLKAGSKIKDWASVIKCLDSEKEDIDQANLSTKASEMLEISKHIEAVNIRKNRLILFGVKACSSQDPKSIQRHEWEIIKSVFDHIGLDSGLVDYCYRCQKGKTVTSRHPPLILVLKPGINRNIILAEAKKLKSIQGYDNIYIRPDRAFFERIIDKELRQARDEYNSEEQKRDLPFRWTIKDTNIYRHDLRKLKEKSKTPNNQGNQRSYQPEETMQHKQQQQSNKPEETFQHKQQQQSSRSEEKMQHKQQQKSSRSEGKKQHKQQQQSNESEETLQQFQQSFHSQLSQPLLYYHNPQQQFFYQPLHDTLLYQHQFPQFPIHHFPSSQPLQPYPTYAYQPFSSNFPFTNY